MTWRDDLYLEGNGSFRGVEFLVDSAESEIGRRTVLHEFPGRDEPEVEDLGRAPRRFVLVAYVVGLDYMVDRDKLRVAFETAGPGPLVHPYWGDMVITVHGKIRIRETPNEGGMARFTLTAIESGADLILVGAVPDTEALVDEAADAGDVAAQEDLEEEWSLVGAIGSVISSAVDNVNAATSTLNQINGKVQAAMNTVNSVGNAIDAIGDAVNDLIDLPGDMAAAFQNVMAGITNTISSIGDSSSTAGAALTSPTASSAATGTQRVDVLMTTLRDMAVIGDDYDAVPETTPQRIQEAANQTAFVAMIQTAGVVATCRTVATLPFASYDQAVAVRDEIGELLDDLADVAGDTSYGALTDLRALVSQHLTEASADLPRVISYTPARSLPALTIAHYLYGDATRDTDIIDRNNVRNPFTVPGGESLEILSDD